jgi:hypothetical protein
MLKRSLFRITKSNIYQRYSRFSKEHDLRFARRRKRSQLGFQYNTRVAGRCVLFVSRIVARSRRRLLCPLIDGDEWEKSPGVSQNLCQMELQASHSKSSLNHENYGEVCIRPFRPKFHLNNIWKFSYTLRGSTLFRESYEACVKVIFTALPLVRHCNVIDGIINQ